MAGMFVHDMVCCKPEKKVLYRVKVWSSLVLRRQLSCSMLVDFIIMRHLNKKHGLQQEQHLYTIGLICMIVCLAIIALGRLVNLQVSRHFPWW